MVKVAIMGYGTIGSGVYEVLTGNRDKIAANVGQEVQVKYILDLRDFPGSPVEDKIVHDFQVIADDPEVQIVVETMGGLNPAYPFVKTCRKECSDFQQGPGSSSWNRTACYCKRKKGKLPV